MKVYITTFTIDGKLVGASTGIGVSLYHDWAVEDINNAVDWLYQLGYPTAKLIKIYDDINGRYSEPMRINEVRGMVIDRKEPGKKVEEIKFTLYCKETKE